MPLSRISPCLANFFFPAARVYTQVYHELKSVIKEKYGQDACNVGDEGGFAPNIQSNLEGIELLMAAIKKAGYEDKVSRKKINIFSGVYVWTYAQGTVVDRLERPRGLEKGSFCHPLCTSIRLYDAHL